MIDLQNMGNLCNIYYFLFWFEYFYTLLFLNLSTPLFSLQFLKQLWVTDRIWFSKKQTDNFVFLFFFHASFECWFFSKKKSEYRILQTVHFLSLQNGILRSHAPLNKRTCSYASLTPKTSLPRAAHFTHRYMSLIPNCASLGAFTFPFKITYCISTTVMLSEQKKLYSFKNLFCTFLKSKLCSHLFWLYIWIIHQSKAMFFYLWMNKIWDWKFWKVCPKQIEWVSRTQIY